MSMPELKRNLTQSTWPFEVVDYLLKLLSDSYIISKMYIHTTTQQQKSVIDLSSLFQAQLTQRQQNDELPLSADVTEFIQSETEKFSDFIAQLEKQLAHMQVASSEIPQIDAVGTLVTIEDAVSIEGGAAISAPEDGNEYLQLLTGTHSAYAHIQVGDMSINSTRIEEETASEAEDDDSQEDSICCDNVADVIEESANSAKEQGLKESYEAAGAELMRRMRPYVLELKVLGCQQHSLNDIVVKLTDADILSAWYGQRASSNRTVFGCLANELLTHFCSKPTKPVVDSLATDTHASIAEDSDIIDVVDTEAADVSSDTEDDATIELADSSADATDINISIFNEMLMLFENVNIIIARRQAVIEFCEDAEHGMEEFMLHVQTYINAMKQVYQDCDKLLKLLWQSDLDYRKKVRPLVHLKSAIAREQGYFNSYDLDSNVGNTSLSCSAPARLEQITPDEVAYKQWRMQVEAQRKLIETYPLLSQAVLWWQGEAADLTTSPAIPIELEIHYEGQSQRRASCG